MLGPVHHPIATIALYLALHAAHGRQQITVTLFIISSHKDVLRATKKVGQGHRTAAQFTFNQDEIEVR